jgi:hypothetical protein
MGDFVKRGEGGEGLTTYGQRRVALTAPQEKRPFRFGGHGLKEAGEVLLNLSKNWLLRGCWKMSICKAFEIPRNEAYREVRRSDEG